MKRFRFRLERLLRLRRQQLQQSELELAARAAELETLRRSRTEQTDAIQRALSGASFDGVDRGAAFTNWIRSLEFQLRSLESEIQAKQAEVLEASQRRRTRSLHVEQVEALRQVRREEYREEVLKLQQQEIDEWARRASSRPGCETDREHAAETGGSR